jgi:hypothetical protein
MDKQSIIKRQILKKAPQSPSPRTSRANRGIYQSGPWSDSLVTTNVKVDGVPKKREREILGGGLGTLSDKIKGRKKF